MTKILELVLCILHPVAVVLIWINLVFRGIVPLVPFVYVLTGNDFI